MSPYGVRGFVIHGIATCASLRGMVIVTSSTETIAEFVALIPSDRGSCREASSLRGASAAMRGVHRAALQQGPFSRASVP